MKTLIIVLSILLIFYLIAKWYKNHNKDILNKYLSNKIYDYLFIEEDNSKAVSVNKNNKTITLYSLNDNDTIIEKSFDIDKINNIEMTEDVDSDQNCKFVRLNIYINDIDDCSLFQIIFLAPTWTLDGYDGYQKNSDKYLIAKQQANKFITIINSLK